LLAILKQQAVLAGRAKPTVDGMDTIDEIEG
jgi:hypothetical protein